MIPISSCRSSAWYSITSGTSRLNPGAAPVFKLIPLPKPFPLPLEARAAFDRLGAGNMALKPLLASFALFAAGWASSAVSFASLVALGRFTLILCGLELSMNLWTPDLVVAAGLDLGADLVGFFASSSDASESEYPTRAIAAGSSVSRG